MKGPLDVRENPGAKAGSILLAAGVAAISALLALAGTLWGFTLKCDDSCSTQGGWDNDPDAWQWDAVGWTSVAGFACALLLVVAVILGRRTLAALALAAWLVLAVSFLRLFLDSGLMSRASEAWLALAAVTIAGVGAIALTRPRGRRPSAPLAVP